jgi:hypothetical protein
MTLRDLLLLKDYYESKAMPQKVADTERLIESYLKKLEKQKQKEDEANI